MKAQSQKQKEYPTQSNYNYIINRIHVRHWESSEDEACKRWFGKRYLGKGMLLCTFCLENQVEFKGYLKDHVCEECQQSLDQLDNVNTIN